MQNQARMRKECKNKQIVQLCFKKKTGKNKKMLKMTIFGQPLIFRASAH